MNIRRQALSIKEANHNAVSTQCIHLLFGLLIFMLLVDDVGACFHSDS